jgi:hypothetical protein
VKPGIQFVLGAATAICLVVGLLYFGMIPGISEGAYVGPTPVMESISPDNQYVARSERMSNKSRDWCEERTTIDRVGEHSDWERQYVFNNECGTPVEFVWKDNRSLLIRYGYDSAGKVHVYREAVSKDKQVLITYELKDGS